MSPRSDGRAGVWIIAPDLDRLHSRRSREFWALFDGDEPLERRISDHLLLTPEEAAEQAAFVADVDRDGVPVPLGPNGEVVRRTVDGRHLYATRYWDWRAGRPDGMCHAAFGIDCPPGWFVAGMPPTNRGSVGGARSQGGRLGDGSDAHFAFDLTEPVLNEDYELSQYTDADAAFDAAFREAERRVAAHAARHSVPPVDSPGDAAPALAA